MIWIIVLSTLVLLYLLLKPQLYWYLKNVKQGVPIPIFGDNFTFLLRQESLFDLAKRLYSRHQNVRYSGIYFTTLPTLMIQDVELLKQLTVKDFDHFTDHRNFARNFGSRVWEKNLFFLKGAEWREMRSTLSPTFTSKKMKAMFELMNESGKQYVDYFVAQNTRVIELELKDSFTRLANDVIANCAFGVTCNSLENPNNEFYLQGKEVTNISGFSRSFRFLINILAPKFAAFFKISTFPDRLAEFFIKLVKNTINYREEYKIVRPDMINLLMEAKNGRLHYDEDIELSKTAGFATVEESDIGRYAKRHSEMTEIDMAGQVLVFFFAGFDTVSTVMSFVAYELAQNPNIQRKLRNEIVSYTSTGDVTYDTLAKMKYLDMVVTETLRKYPPFAAVDRVCTKPYTIEPKYPDEKPIHFKIGDRIWIPIVGFHYDSRYYPNPDFFDPERFSDENKANIQPYTYLPFGIGPRNCIGSRFALMEVKILFCYLLSKFEIVVTEKTAKKVKMGKLAFNPTMEGGFWLGFKKMD